MSTTPTTPAEFLITRSGLVELIWSAVWT